MGTVRRWSLRWLRSGGGWIHSARRSSGGLRYDLLRANALKTACALAFTSVALVIFIAFDQVWWIPGLILATGSMAGAHLAVKVAVRASQESIKWFLFSNDALCSHRWTRVLAALPGRNEAHGDFCTT